MKYALGRALEVIGLAIVPLGLLTAFAYQGSVNAIKYEILCLAAGAVIFYTGHLLRRGAER